MNDPRGIVTLATLLLAAGIWLLLPRGRSVARTAGGLLAAVGLGLVAMQMPPLGNWVASGLFYVLAGTTVAAAVGAVSSTNPVYCAIWFGLSLIGTAGLFLLNGAQFLAVATIVVYAGAILVTFLFVLMLAHPYGDARYDRVSWEPLIAAATGAVLVGVLSMTVAEVFGEHARVAAAAAVNHDTSAPSGAAAALTPPAPEALDANILTPQHVARFGTELFARHLLAVEVAGVLLLAALVGAAVIIAQARAARVGRDAAG
ncbi:MAG: NADH-quinone oxidoreductase subunit J [Planctomycetota bacterium]